MKKLLILFVITFLYISCKNEPIEVLVNTNFWNNNKVHIDSEIKQILGSKGDYSTILLTKGKHEITINEGEPKEIVVRGKSGMLNLTHEKFVLFSIPFYKDLNKIRSLYHPIPVIFDSLIVYNKLLGSTQSEVLKLLNNEVYDYQLRSSGGGRINHEKLYISKKWNYSINDIVPEEIEEKMPSDWDLIVKKKLMRDLEFLFIAKSSDQYIVEPIENEELIERVKYFEY